MFESTLSESPVYALGYVLVESADVEGWRSLALDVLGMAVEPASDPGLFLRMDERIARFVIRDTNGVSESGEPGRVSLGWECRGQAEWRRAHDAIAGAGLPILDEGRSTPWYKESFACLEPGGIRCEFFYGGKVDPARPFVSQRGIAFVTGGQGMGHITLGGAGCEESAEFYATVLGFQVRETSTVDGRLRWAFLSPNEREHSVAFIAGDGPMGVRHVLVEVDSIDAVGRAMDQCLDGCAPMSVSLGRHWNDGMVSFYVRTPDGFDIEYGHGGRVVDAAEWSHREQGGSGAVSIWGHRIVRPDGTLGPQIGQREPPKAGAVGAHGAEREKAVK